MEVVAAFPAPIQGGGQGVDDESLFLQFCNFLFRQTEALGNNIRGDTTLL